MCLGEMRSVSAMMMGFWIPGRTVLSCTPQKNWMTERTISIRPNEAITSMITGASRSGR